MKLLSILLAVCLVKISFAQVSTPYADVIQKKKKISIPIIGKDRTFNNQFRHMGTSFIVQMEDTNCIVFITCEHVVAIKDSITQKTIRTVEKIFANLNLTNDSILTLPLDVIYRDEINDFAILQLKDLNDLKLTKKYNLSLNMLHIKELDEATDLREGETLLYIGYPMSFGVGKKNYPISRSGFVSQNIEDSSKFLMDGFVQGGYSGSPVYRIKENPSKMEWKFKVVGIVQAYPNEYLYVRPNNSEKIKITTNPGFTIVGKMKPIIEKLKKAECIK
ncbi:MAG: serine protease [Lacibacter sp.]